jgi:hemolysin III
MMQEQVKPMVSAKEEIFNAITHGVGTMIAIAGLTILTVFTNIIQEPGYLVYGISLVLLYLISTLYHSISHVRTKNVFRKLDHMAIFLFIAGTYTPYCINVLTGWVRWILLISIWGCALLGIIIKCFYTGKLEWLSLVFYLLMGWMVIFVIKPIYDSLPFPGFLFLLIGGLAYTIGTYFYMNRRIRFGHGIWHLWVLAGSAFHFFSILMLI